MIVGFANKPYERTHPRLRHLTKPEKEVLYVLKAIEQDLSPVEANATGAAKLDEVAIQFKIEKLGVMQSVNASEIRDKILSFQQAPADSPLRKQLESISIEIITTDAKLNVDLQYLTDLQRLLRDQQLPSRLLALNEVSPVVPGKDFIDPTYTYMLLFIVVIIVLWFGCNNAAKEIVKEEAIYGRERAVNLGILPYLASKFLC